MCLGVGFRIFACVCFVDCVFVLLDLSLGVPEFMRPAHCFVCAGDCAPSDWLLGGRGLIWVFDSTPNVFPWNAKNA